MVTTFFEPAFEKFFASVKDELIKIRIKKQIARIVLMPNIGKPMRYGRKGTREVYLLSFRLSYLWNEEEQRIVFLDSYHKDEQ